MKNHTPLTNSIDPVRNSRNRPGACWTRAFPLIPVAVAFGWFALAPAARAVLPAPDGGYPNFNTAEGEDALFSLTTGIFNTAIGYHALYKNSTGYWNTANGANALFSNIDGQSNTANGVGALYSNTSGIESVAIGYNALYGNTTGEGNVANGAFALESNTTGIVNTASGGGALLNNTTGYGNTATGSNALWTTTTGYFNTASGYTALYSNTTGHNNIALGYSAGFNLTTGSSNIDIGNGGVAGEAGVIRIGTAGTQTATFIAGIRETPLAAAVGIGITADGQLGVRPSAAHFKEGIKPMDKASEVILALKPVTFHYRKALDPKGLPQFGLVAEEVAKVDPALVISDAKGKPFTVRYDEVNAMLLNEFLKEHRKVEEEVQKNQKQEANITELKFALAQQEKEIQTLTAQIRRVSERLDVSKPALQLIVRNR